MNPLSMILSLGVVSGLFAVIPDADASGNVWAQWGLAGLVCGVTLYRDWQREQRMSAAMDAQTKWVQETLVAALDRQSAAIEKLNK